MLHLRIVSPPELTDRTLALLSDSRAVINVVHLPDVVRSPTADLVLADVAKEDASVVIADLRALGLEEEGSIALEQTEAQLSRRGERAVEAARGAPSDAVVWEEVEGTTSEATELSASFVLFMLAAGLIAAVGIYEDSPILIVGAMVVGPEFGPIAGFCVAVAARRADLARRSMLALGVGFPVTILTVFGVTLVFKATGIAPASLDTSGHSIANVIADPDFLAFFVAACAGVAGMLSLSTAKSGALIGVLISVTTIPAAANVGVAAAYGDGHELAGSAQQLAVNVSAILLAGTATLVTQRWLFDRRRRNVG